MVLRNAIAAALCTGLLMSGGAALADEYRAGELIGLDLSNALLSPKRLGPETEFAPVRIEARTDRKPVKTERVVVAKAAAPKPRPGSSRPARGTPWPAWDRRRRAIPPAATARLRLRRRGEAPRIQPSCWS